jgi:hypothetical protein
MRENIEGTAEGQIVATLESTFRRYVALDSGLPLVLALWTLATYIFDCFDALPYLAITSPTIRCGKTRLGEVLKPIACKGSMSVGISVAALFRVIDREHPTLIIDEAESLRDRSERASALREILNAGFRRGQTVRRCLELSRVKVHQRGKSKSKAEAKSYVPQEYDVYCPKVLICIGSLPDTVADRSIPIRMHRRSNETLARFRFSRFEREAADLKADIERLWTEARKRAVAEWYENNDLFFLQDREAEIWLPLFAVCAIVAPDRIPELEAAARALADAKAADEPSDLGIRLLADIGRVFQAHLADRLHTAVILDDLNGIEDSPWPGWSHGKGVDARALSKLLGPFGINPQDVRIAETVRKGYMREQFADAWKRYLAPSSRDSATEGINSGGNGVLASATERECSGTQS